MFSSQFSEGDGRLGYLEYAPYDIIHVGAAAPKTPQTLLNQLKNGGRLICPVGPQNGDQYLEQVKLDEFILKNTSKSRKCPIFLFFLLQ